MIQVSELTKNIPLIIFYPNYSDSDNQFKCKVRCTLTSQSMRNYQANIKTGITILFTAI